MAKTKETKEEKKQKLSEQEYEQKVITYAEQGLTAEKIGTKLKHENIHPPEYKKKIGQMLKEHKKYTQPDLKNVEEKLVCIRTHAEKNKQDRRAQRELARVQSQVRTLKTYHNIPLK